MDNIKLADAQPAKTVYVYKRTKEKIIAVHGAWIILHLHNYVTLCKMMS
jgi:hypothetical protein